MGSPLFRLLLTLLIILAGVVVLSLPFLLLGRRPPIPLTAPVVLSDSGAVPADSLPLDSTRAVAALAQVLDPELRLPVTDLGLLESLAVLPDRSVRAVLAMTRPDCPFGRKLGELALEALVRLPGVTRVQVRIDPHIAWTQQRLSPAARERFRDYFRLDTSRTR